VEASTFAISPPADAHVVNLSMRGGKDAKRNKRAARKLPFQVSAPATLAGRKQTAMRVLHGKVALIRYGNDLDSLLVVEKAAKAEKPGAPARDHRQLELPTVDINGATAKVIDTPLGSIVTFQRGGVSYTVLGSVHAADVEAAARGL
jgi:hypothetical protein